MASSPPRKARAGNPRVRAAGAAGTKPEAGTGNLTPESPRAFKVRVKKILTGLHSAYPDPRCALDHENPLQLLVATILSAQCTDERVNKVTPALFRRYPGAASLARARRESIETLIRSTGFFRNKAKSIQGAARQIVEKHDGEVPRTMEELLELDGVARKTANVVLGVAHGVAVGVVVDTHVSRISRLLGLTAESDPVKIERDLMAILPPSEWIDFSHRLIQHGRAVCIARRPRCGECVLAALCPSCRTDAAGS